MVVALPDLWCGSCVWTLKGQGRVSCVAPFLLRCTQPRPSVWASFSEWSSGIVADVDIGPSPRHTSHPLHPHYGQVVFFNLLTVLGGLSAGPEGGRGEGYLPA